MNKDNKQYASKFLQFSAIGLEMGACVGIGVYLGYLADEKFGSDPWGKIIGIFLGLSAAASSLYKTFKKLRKMDEDAEKE